MEFEKLLNENKYAVERFTHFKISNFDDAEDIIQETYITAFQKFDSIHSVECFKPWIISIAKNKCNDYYRRKAKSIETIAYNSYEVLYQQNIFGRTDEIDVSDTMYALSDDSRKILEMFYFAELSQAEIANRLRIPIGTVKSRLHYAKKKFKEKYPYTPNSKGDTMNSLPKIMPEYKITKSDKKPFEAEWQELMGWLIVPKLNEKITWALYDFPERKQTQLVEMEVIGKAEVHSIEGVEISAKEYNPIDSEKTDNDLISERRFIAQLTDTHCRFLAESHKINGVNKYYTFLDGDDFIKNWGFGEDNCGKETTLIQKNIITRNNNIIEVGEKEYCMDVVGRYTVMIDKKEFDTICLMDIKSYDTGVVTEQYIDRNGKTVLWRRFNADDWNFDKYKQKWSEKLPFNEQLIVNGKTYVHWYDCISDYVI